jgi:hypothetical protein
VKLFILKTNQPHYCGVFSKFERRELQHEDPGKQHVSKLNHPGFAHGDFFHLQKGLAEHKTKIPRDNGVFS